ncbi:MAG: hypothetical protein QOI84_1387 [Solirubrobacterales bacterium]|jgi:hypothetical protein|nr:hypothetical protein [Solirubrobacterales bacterium]
MGLIGNLLGTPKEHEREKAENEVVKVPEFDITQYAKKLGVTIGVIAAAAAAALEIFHVTEITPGIVIGAFGLIAAAVLAVSFVMAIDIAARAYLTGEGSAEKAKESPSDSDLVSAPPGTMVWLEDDDDPHPVLAIAHDGGKVSSYLVAAGSTVDRGHDGERMKAIDGTPKWQSADTIRALKPPKWP